MAGCQDLSDKWGGYQMLYNISEHKSRLDAMCGFKETVTEHSTVEVLTFMDYRHDVANYENSYQKIINSKK